jgi:hypothetical protein
MSENVNKVNEEQVNAVIEKLESKDFGIYFFTLDTKGNPVAGIANIYEHVKVLNQLGYRAYILHEKNDYKKFGDEDENGLGDWLGEEYANLPHMSIESGALNVGPQDFLIIPEAFSSVMQQKEVRSLPCKKIVFSQSHEYIFELLPLGRRWTDFGFNDVITTSEKQGEYLKTLFPSIKTHVVPVAISSYFKASNKPKLPIVTIHTRNQSDVSKITKSFYLQYPIYKWLTFKELRGLSKAQFADELSKSCLAIWVDDVAGFGTFPLEAIECETPVIGKIPNMVPEWMEELDSDGQSVLKYNGLWTNSTLNIPELISTYMKVWLEDSVPQELLDGMAETKGVYSEENQSKKIEEVYSSLVQSRTDEFKNIIDSLKTESTIK